MDPNTTDSAGAAPVVKKERKPLKKPVNSEAVAFDPL